MRRMARQCAMIVAGPRQNREGNAAREFKPATPTRKLLQNIGAHQPDEVRAREPQQQSAQRVDGVVSAKRRLYCAGDNAAPVRDAARGGQALAERRHAALRLQRIARRDQQPNLIEPQPSPRNLDDMAMPAMRRIERTAEKTDAHSPSVAKPRDRIMRERHVQGRTCPVPVTT